MEKKPQTSGNPSVSHMVENIVGCKWSMTVLAMIRSGTNRPGAMVREVDGLTAKVLNERLAKLIRFGIAEKTVFPVTPPHVEYRLTSFGEKFVGVIDEIERLQIDLDQTE